MTALAKTILTLAGGGKKWHERSDQVAGFSFQERDLSAPFVPLRNAKIRLRCDTLNAQNLASQFKKRRDPPQTQAQK